MNTKHYLVISGIIGGVIGSLLTALLVSPVTAQKDKFGEIECTKLTVVDEAGQQNVVIAGGENGGLVTVSGKDGKPAVDLRAYVHGGFIVVHSRGWKGVAGFGGKGKVFLGVDGRGDGFVSIWDDRGNQQ